MMKLTRSKPSTLALVKLVCRALDAKKAEDIRVLDVSAQSSITDFLVVANGTSEPHLRALRVELEKVLDAAKVRIVGIARKPLERCHRAVGTKITGRRRAEKVGSGKDHRHPECSQATARKTDVKQGRGRGAGRRRNLSLLSG
jgi:hypothetical protein